MSDRGEGAVPEHIGLTPPGTIDSLFEELDAEIRGERVGLSLPWPSLDGLVDGLRPGGVTVLAGKEGSGKSYLALAIGLHCWLQGYSWRYMPCERTAEYWLRRMVAVKANDWRVTGIRPETGQEREQILREHREFMEGIRPHMCENPRLPGPDGRRRELLSQDAARWLVENAQMEQLTILDPLTKVDWKPGRGESKWDRQIDFVKAVTDGVAQTSGHVILITHMSKDGMMVKGVGEVTQIVDNVFLFWSHEELENEVGYKSMLSSGPDGQLITHRHTMLLDKVRDGPGDKKRLAYDFDDGGPELHEKGIIKPKGKKK